MTRSLSIFVAFVAVVVGIAVAGTFGAAPVQAGPSFRIIDVRYEYGQLVVEVEHFKDGKTWFYELYTFQGREQYKQPRVTDQLGNSSIKRMFIKRDGRVAPIRRNSLGEKEHYLPEGEEWLRQNRPHMDADSITRVIQRIHEQRLVAGWDKGKQRLTLHPMDATLGDRNGARLLAARFAGLKTIAYTTDDQGTLLVYNPMRGVPLAAIDPFVSKEWGTVSTFYPGASAIDGEAGTNGCGCTWSTMRGAAGAFANDTAAYFYAPYIASDSLSNKWDNLTRGITLFDTAGLADTDIISSADLVVTTQGKYDSLGITPDVNVYSVAPTSDTSLASGDFGTFGTTAFSTAIAYGSLAATNSDNTFALNASGIAAISLTGITKLGFRNANYDVADVAPSWSSALDAAIKFHTSRETEPADHRPTLIVTHAAPAAAITGTIGDGATEQEVRDGGGTVIITLTGATWAAAGGTFDGQRQNIIDGLDSAQSETYGWNAEVRDKIGVTSAVRTSDTIATITLTASEVADYRIDSAETITVTVPASAISIAGAITATPTIAITPGAESVTVGGTLGASGGTAAEIIAGGETVLLTLANTAWVADGSTFNAQRQNIIDGLTSDKSDTNGWNNRRADFAVGDVVRTSATVVTITLSASSAYAIPQAETVTAVVPASALVYAAALTGSPLFEIVPAFALSGTRVSGPIDLSGVTDVAYCAIGWQASTPAGTTVTVETSIDGGVAYSTATNGSCPTGITVSSSLASITDFRTKIYLTTNDNTVTPLVEGLGLLVQDTSGPALYYRLNTIPGVTITDRSANSNAGTLSFPTRQTGINATTGVLESTRSSLSLEQLLSVGDIVSPVTGAAASGNIFNQTETGFGSLPFQSMMQTMATGGELPLKFVWVVAIGLFSIALGVVALHMTGSLMISGIGLGAGLSVGAAIGGGLIPGWTVILFVILALALVVMRSRGALPL